jgi:hypothetical protein
LGDAANVDTAKGAWTGVIRDCSLSNVTTGYGIYSASSQSWDIRNNNFLAVKFPIYYNTVVGGAVISRNTIDNSAIALGSGSVGIFARPGTLGGSVGMSVSDNYMIGVDVGVHLCSIGGAYVTGNQIEATGTHCIILTKYLLDAVTVDGAGCFNCTIQGNTFINWNGNSPYTAAAIQVSYSFSNYIGKNCYQSPTGTTGFGIGVFDTTTINNLFVEPIITGSNSTTSPFQLNNSTLAQNMIHAENYIGFPNSNAPSRSGWGDGEIGRVWFETKQLRVWGAQAGASQGVNYISLDGTRTSANGGATIDISGATTVVITNAAPQTVTALTDTGVFPGKEVTFYASLDSNTTFGSALGTRGGSNYNLPQFGSITFVYINSTIGWSEKCRKD